MKTVKNRKRKFALGIKIAAMLSCVAIASVGFASWLIISNTNIEPTGGNIVASDVDAAGVTLSHAWKNTASDTEQKIVFGYDKDYTPNGSEWLVPGSGVESDSLTETLTVTYTLSNVTSADLDIGFSVTDSSNADVTGKEGVWTKASEYVGVKIIIGDTEYIYGSNFDPKISVTTSGSTDVTITFFWKLGATEENEGQNPYKYFNGKTQTDKVNESEETTWQAYAQTALKAIYALNNCQFKVTVTATNVKTSAS